MKNIFNIAQFNDNKDEFESSNPELAKHYEVFQKLRESMIEAVEEQVRSGESYNPIYEEQLRNSLYTIARDLGLSDEEAVFYIETRLNQYVFYTLTRKNCGFSSDLIIESFKKKVRNRGEKFLISARAVLIKYRWLCTYFYKDLFVLKDRLGEKRYEYFTIQAGEESSDIELKYFLKSVGHAGAVIHDRKTGYWYYVSPNNFMNTFFEDSLFGKTGEFPEDRNGETFDRLRSIIFADSYEKLRCLVEAIEGGSWTNEEDLWRVRDYEL